MKHETKCAAVGSLRTLLNFAILTLLGGGATFTATGVAAQGAGEQGYHDRDSGHGHGNKGGTCFQTTQVAFRACGNDVKDNYLIAKAKCLNVADADERSACFAEAEATREDDANHCSEVRDARLQVCETLTIGGGPYDPAIDPNDFVAADQIMGNEYFPLKPGTQWVYENTDDETITVTVTDQTSEIEGIPVRVVTDVVVDGDGKTTEDTEDWYAQDVYGNVWYMGEKTVATDPDTMLSSVDGTWKTGVDGAKPGTIMPAVFTVGDVYRQEWLLGDAEDIAENLSKTATADSPAASCSGNCLKTHEYSPLEPDKSESKIYAPNVGVIVTLDDNNPTFREELVQFTAP